jgi:uncharacterized protein (TIGR00369 family)
MSEEAQRTRTVSWQDPRRGAEAARGLSGLACLEAMLRGELEPPPIAALLGLELVEVAEGRAVFEVTPGEHHYNPIGVVHGGLLATLADSAMACAVHSRLPAGVSYTTVQLDVHLVRPLTVASGRVRCEGRVLHLGSRVATAEARATDAQGRLCAHATTTCLVLGPERG